MYSKRCLDNLTRKLHKSFSVLRGIRRSQRILGKVLVRVSKFAGMNVHPRFAVDYMINMEKQFLLCCLLSLSTLAFCSCATHTVREGTVLPRAEISPVFVQRPDLVDVPGHWDYAWWESFGDETLSRLIEEGLASNFNLQQFAARIEKAAALARQAGSRLWPGIDLTAGYEREEGGGGAAPSSDSGGEKTDLGVLLRWEADFWGRLSSARKAREFEVEATVEDWLDAGLLLSSAIAENYFQIKEHRRQLEVIQAQIVLNESLLQLTRLRFGQGQSSIVAVLQQRERLNSSKAGVPDAEARLGQLEYAMDVLLGRPPGSGNYRLSGELAVLPPLPEVGIPAALLQRRPDLRAARQRIMALDYWVAEAVARQFPNLTLGGRVDWQGDPDFGDALSSLFAGLAAPLFDAGERRSEVDVRKAELEDALASYSNNFLSALLEVESALLVERKLEERLALVLEQLSTARRLLAETRNRFSQGLTDYLPVITSLEIVQDLEREVVNNRRNVLSSRVALHRALGGPMKTPSLIRISSNSNAY